MATAPNRPHREEVQFAPNVPVTCALKYAQGKTVSGMSGERIMYSLLDGRVMFLDLAVASQIEQLGINVRESFTLTKRWDGNKESPATWHVARAAGEQPNGTFVVPVVPVAPAVPVAADPKPPARATSSGLVDEATALVDAYAEVLRHALTKHEGRVKPDEVRALLITSYIQRCKLSSCA